MVQLLRESGFFTANETDIGKARREDMLVVVRVGDLQRAVAFPQGDESNLAASRIQARADALAGEFSWQLWWNRISAWKSTPAG